jgi:alpha-L-rhamnosidase
MKTKVKFFFVLVVFTSLLIFCSLSKAEYSDIEAVNLKCEYQTDPLAIDVRNPRLSWLLHSNIRGQRQTAYRIIVASKRENLKKDHGDLWDSRKVSSTMETFGTAEK